MHIKLKAIDESRKYSEIKTFVLGNDTLRLALEDTVRWRFWSEKIKNKKYMVTLTPMDAKKSNSYFLEKDTINHILTLKPLINTPSKHIKLKYKDLDDRNWHIEGQINGKNISVDLKKILPEESVILMKTKRNLLNIDRKD